jgi:hypothetical protein
VTFVNTGAGEPVDDPREHAIARLKRKRKFAQDSVAYVAANGLLWLIWLFTHRTTGGGIPWPAWVSLACGFFLALDGWRAYSRWPASLNPWRASVLAAADYCFCAAGLGAGLP